VFFFGNEGEANIMIMEKLGKNLETLFNECSRIFSIKTILNIAIQILSRIQFFHSKCYIHRDIKPENFLIGIDECNKLIYLIDFGLSKLFKDPVLGTHIAYVDHKSFTGTARYASISTHIGIEQSRRDDLESIGHMLIYFVKGMLPWQGI